MPPGLDVTCADQAQCPSDARCNPLTGRCEFNVGVAAPSTAFAQVGPAAGRAATLVSLAIDALDSNAPPVGDEVVRFTLAYSRDGATWCDATLAETDLPAVGAEATRLTLLWNALADAQGANPCGLTTTTVPNGAADDASFVTVLGFADGVRLRLTAEDSGVPPSRSDIVSPPFAIGNDAPVTELIDDGAVLRQASPFEYTLADSSLDEARIEVQFRIEGPTPSPWYGAQIRGATNGVLADALDDASARLLVWNADAPIPLDTSLTGGIGRRNASVTLRIRAVEDVLEGVTTYGAWATRAATVFNQTQPVIGAIDVAPVEKGDATSVVMLGYEVIDGEADDVDLRVDYRLPGSSLWSRATPYPVLPHSGEHDLASSATVPPRHVFMWNAAADVRNRVSQLLVRLTAADEGGISRPAEVAVSFAVGVEPLAAVTHPVATTASYFAADNSLNGAILASGDFDGDGLVDIAVWAGDDVETFRGVAGGGIGAHAATGPSTYRSRSFVVADFNGDGRDDIAARMEQDFIEVRLGSPTGVTAAPSASIDPGTPNSNILLAAGDIDGNGTVDLVTNGFINPVGGPFYTLDIYRGDGNGGFGAAESLVLAAREATYALAVGDFDGDGRDDVAFAVQNGEPFGQQFQTVPIELRVRRGASSGSPPLTADAEVIAQGTANNADGPLINAGLAAGNLFDDAREELVFLDLQQSNLGRLRVFARDATWALQATTADMPPMRRVHIEIGAEDVVTVGNHDRARGYTWDAGQRRLSLATPDLQGVGDDLFFADRTGDGRRDLMVATAMQLQWRPAIDAKGMATGAFDGGAAFDRLVPDGNLLLLVADNDEDGIGDLLAIDGQDETSHAASAFHGESVRDVPTHALSAIAPPVPIVPGGTFLGNPTDDAQVGDFDGDGRLDALIASTNTSHFIALGDGTPLGFAPGRAFLTGGGSYRLLSGDFDGDGRDDIVSTDTPRVIQYARLPATPSWQIAALGFVDGDAFAAGDADNDGIDDLVVGTSFSPLQVRVYFGNSPAGLSAPVTIAVPGTTGVSALAVGDVDGDGLNEVVAATGAVTRVYDVTRAGLAALPTSNAGIAFRSFELVDVDTDGILDIAGFVAPTPLERTFYVQPGLEAGGRPSGRFGPVTRILGPIPVPLGGVAWGDANRDSLPDLFVGDAQTGLVLAFYNRRYHPTRSWSTTLDATSLLGTPVGTDRFGDPWSITITARRTSDRPSVVTTSGERRTDFAGRLRASGLGVPASARAASFAWQFAGDFAASSRTTAGARRGYLRQTLAGRDAVVRLPLYDGATTDPTKLLVYARRVGDYENVDGELPVTADGRTVYRPLETWVEVPRVDDLAAGTGPRFVVDAAAREVRVATDALGVFRVYATP